MDAFYKHVLMPDQVGNNFLRSASVLMRQDFEMHKESVQFLLSHIESPINLLEPSPTDRDVVLAQIRLAVCDVLERSSSRWKKLVYPHMDFIDCNYEIKPMQQKTMYEIGGDELVNLLQDYEAVRNLHNEDPITQLPKVKRKIKAQENDTAHTIATRYNCTVENLQGLNPELTAKGFGANRGGKLRRGTVVVIMD